MDHWNGSQTSNMAGFEAKRAKMRKGPTVEVVDGEKWIVVPSAVYNSSLRRLWPSKGFHFDREREVWTRPVNTEFKGKVYSAEAWMKSVCREYRAHFPANY